MPEIKSVRIEESVILFRLRRRRVQTAGSTRKLI